jgi:hypothetical protein
MNAWRAVSCVALAGCAGPTAFAVSWKSTSPRPVQNLAALEIERSYPTADPDSAEAHPCGRFASYNRDDRRNLVVDSGPYWCRLHPGPDRAQFVPKYQFNDTVTFYPPFPTWQGENTAKPICSVALLPQLRWAPLDLVESGAETLKAIELAAHDESLLSEVGMSACPTAADVCSTYISSITRDSRKAFLRCRVAITQGSRGAPENCVPAAVLTDTPSLRVVYQIQEGGILCAMAAVESYNTSTAIEDVMVATERALRSNFGFSTAFVPTTDRSYLRATSYKRPSAVLQGVREQATIHIRTWRTASAIMQIEIYLSLIVNEQNTASAEDWHSATEAQEGAYANAIVTTFWSAARSTCTRPRQYVVVDARTATCR